MTATAQESPRAEPSAAGGYAAPAGVVRRPHSRRSNRRRRNLLGLQVATTVVFVGLVAGLGWVGYRSTLSITGGSSLEVTDPEAPGFVAEVKPTPVDLLALTDADGALVAGLMLAAGPEGAGGVVMPLPADMSVPGVPGLVPPVRVEDLRTLEQVFDGGGVQELRNRVGESLTFGFTSVAEVPPTTMEELAALAGPITVTIPENVLELQLDGEEVVRYRAGEVTLQPDELGPFLAFSGSNESVPNQELRHDAVWKSLVTALADVDRERLERIGRRGTAEGGPGVGELLAGLLDGEVRYDTVPLEAIPVPDTIYIVYGPDPAALPTFVVRNVPSPTSGVPGQRARVRVLNGTTDPAAVNAVVPKVVGAMGEVTLVGNAESFDVATTRVEFSVPEARFAADQIAQALGVRAQRVDRPAPGSVDVDVVVGGDRTS